MRAPEFVLARDVAKRLKRNRCLDGPSVRGQHALRFHHDIRIEVFILAVGPDAVRLHAKRIEIKLVSFAMVVEGIEKNSDVVIVKNVIAFGYVGAHLVGLVIAVKRDVKKLRIITQQHFGRLGWCKVVTRLDLIEIRSEEHTSELQSLTNLVCRLL